MYRVNIEDLYSQVKEVEGGRRSMLVVSIMDLPSLIVKMTDFGCDRFEVTLFRTFGADDGAPFACVLRTINEGA
jgi:hypothetical protein